MATTPHYIYLDLKIQTQYSVVKVTQNDTNVNFILRIFDDGQSDFNLLDQFSNITLTSQRPDKKSFYVTGEKIDGTNEVSFNLGTSELELEGKVRASAQFYSVDGRKSSAQFSYEVEKDLTGDYTPSENEASLIEAVLVDGPRIMTEAEAATLAAMQAMNDLTGAVTGSLDTLQVEKEAALAEMATATELANAAAENADMERQQTITDVNEKIEEVETVRLSTVEVSNNTLLVKDQTIAVRDSTQAVQEATELVRQNTEAERLATETVRTSTENERLATESVKDATQLVQDATDIVRQDTLAEKNATEVVRLATVVVKDETEIVKNETILVKDEATQVIIDTNIAKDNTIQAGLDAIQATSDANQATTEAITATENAQSIVDNTDYKGEFNIETAYKKNNIVGLDGSSYIAIQDTTGSLPTDNLNWKLLARKGIDGLGSVSSVNNVSPDANGNVVLEIASDWSEIQGKPDTFAPSAHSHEIADVNGLADALSGAESNAVTTSVASSNTYTDTQIAGLVESAPETLDTLNELASALGDDPNFATTVSNQIGTKVDKVAGKGLSTEDFTTEEKTKLTTIESNANNYSHPSTHPATMITGLSTVASSGSYNDLINKPTIPAAVTLNNTVTSTSTTEAATANAVKQAYDRAELAFQSGNNVKSDMVAALLAVDPALPITVNSSWEEIEAATGGIEAGGGLRSASGTATRTGTGLSFVFAGVDAFSNPTGYVQVNGLNFKPRLIVITSGNGTFDETTIYNAVTSNSFYTPNIKTAYYDRDSLGSTVYISQNFKGDVSPASVTNQGFLLPVSNSIGSQFDWVAFE